MPEQENASRRAGLKRIGGAAVCGALACTLGVGAAAAYLTGIATAENPFTLDTNLKIQLTEPSFSAAKAKNVKPQQTVAKDPTVTNAGSIDAYVAMDIKVPVFTGNAVVDGGTAALTDADLFSYDINAGWTQTGTPELADGYRTYHYVYDAPLASGSKTSSLFDAVTLANLTEDVGISSTSLDVTAHAIQSDGFASAAEAYAAYATQAHATTTLGV